MLGMSSSSLLLAHPLDSRVCYKDSKLMMNDEFLGCRRCRERVRAHPFSLWYRPLNSSHLKATAQQLQSRHCQALRREGAFDHLGSVGVTGRVTLVVSAKVQAPCCPSHEQDDQEDQGPGTGASTRCAGAVCALGALRIRSSGTTSADDNDL